MGLTVHHLQVSQSERVIFLCEEIGLDYTLKNYARDPVLAPADYKSLHPIGAAPVIQDGDTILAESEACIIYIDSVYNNSKLQLKPGDKGYADYLYWLSYTNGTLQPNVSRLMTLVFAGVDKDNQTFSRYRAKMDQLLEFLNQRLGQAPYLAGDRFSLADVMIAFSLTHMRKFYSIDLTPYPNIAKYLQEKIATRDGYLRALKKGDPESDLAELTAAKAPALFPPLQKHK